MIIRFLTLLIPCTLHVTGLYGQHATIEPRPALCHGSHEGIITVTLSAIKATAQLRLMEAHNYRQLQTSNPISDTSITYKNLKAGNYLVQLVLPDTSEEYSVILPEPEALEARSIEIADVKGKGESVSVNLKANCFGGTPPYSISWSENTGNQTGDYAKNLSFGIYTCTLTDKNNCGPKSATFFLFEDEIEKFNQK